MFYLLLALAIGAVAAALVLIPKPRAVASRAAHRTHPDALLLGLLLVVMPATAWLAWEPVVVPVVRFLTSLLP